MTINLKFYCDKCNKNYLFGLFYEGNYKIAESDKKLAVDYAKWNHNKLNHWVCAKCGEKLNNDNFENLILGIDKKKMVIQMVDFCKKCADETEFKK